MNLVRNEKTPEGKAIWQTVRDAAAGAPEWVKQALKDAAKRASEEAQASSQAKRPESENS